MVAIKKDRKFKVSEKIMLGIFGMIVIISGTMLGYDEINVKREEKEFQVLSEKMKVSDNNENGVNILNLKQENDDIVGWVRIGGTRIDYPVMQNLNDSEYYLYKDFKRNKSISGTPFLGEGVSLNPRSTNIIIYAHNMKNKTMFNNLLLYKDKEFWEEHKIIKFSTLDGEEEYEIFTAFETTIIKEQNEMPYYKFINSRGEVEFDRFITKVKGNGFYETNINPSYGDELITLSTCSYNEDDGRFVVIGRKVKQKS